MSLNFSFLFHLLKGGNEPVLAVDFYPGDSKRLATCGKSHIAFWKLNDEKKLEKKMGVFEVTALINQQSAKGNRHSFSNICLKQIIDIAL